MIYKRLSKKEMLKALEEHATFYSNVHSECLEWNDDLECYKYITPTVIIYINRFDDIEQSAGLIKAINVITVMGHDIDSMIGSFRCSDWLVEIPEEGEQ